MVVGRDTRVDLCGCIRRVRVVAGGVACVAADVGKVVAGGIATAVTWAGDAGGGLLEGPVGKDHPPNQLHLVSCPLTQLIFTTQTYTPPSNAVGFSILRTCLETKKSSSSPSGWSIQVIGWFCG